MSAPELVLVAHGTRDPRGVATVRELAGAVRAHEVSVTVAFVDVLGPTVSEVLATLAGRAVLVPAFLAAGYHVRTDVPGEVSASGHRAVRVTRALGPDPALAVVQHERLFDAGWRPGDAVVLAAVGSTDARARADVAVAAELLSEELGAPVRHGFAVAATPAVTDVVAQARRDGAGRVFVASYLLASGLFQTQLAGAGADGVAAPLGPHPLITELLLRRYRDAVPQPWRSRST